MNIEHYRLPPSFERRIVAFYSYKGGVGRTLALCHVAAYLAKQSEPVGERKTILCIDFDLDAPGIAAFFSPDSPTPCRGVLGLLLDYQAKAHLPIEARLLWLRQALRPAVEGATSFSYYVKDTSKRICVLPVGDVSDEDRGNALLVLQLLLRGEGAARDSETDAPRTEFFADLRAVLRDEFAYTLIDSRTGLADEAFATTVLLAESLVVMFRPSKVHLAGVQRVVARYLVEHRLTTASLDVPVLPVLSPRPASSDAGLRQFRELTYKVFPWVESEGHQLRSEVTAEHGVALGVLLPPPLALVELPFDHGIQVGDRMIISVDPTVAPEDAAAPLYKSYETLAQSIQMGNSRGDLRGARILANQHSTSGTGGRSLDLQLLLATIGAHPEDVRLWEQIEAQYGTRTLRSMKLRHLLTGFCEQLERNVIESGSGSRVTRFFVDYWMSRLALERAPEMATERLADAWDGARKLQDPKLLEMVLSHLGENPMPEPTTRKRLPSPIEVAHSRMYLMTVRRPPTIEGLLDGLHGLELVFRSDPNYHEFLLDLLYDQLGLIDSIVDRTLVLQEIAKEHVLRLQFPEALRAAYTAATLVGSPNEAKRDYFYLVSRIGSTVAARAALPTLAPEKRQRAEFVSAFLQRSDLDVIRHHAAVSAEASTGQGTPILLAFALAHHGQFDEAYDILSANRIDKDDMHSWVRARLIGWLAKKESLDAPVKGAIDEHVKDWAIENLRDNTSELFSIVERVPAAALLAADYRHLTKYAVRQLELPRARLQHFGWLVLALAAGDVKEIHLEEFEATLREFPLTAAYLASDEDFRFLRPVWERLYQDAVLTEPQFTRFHEILKRIEDSKLVWGRTGALETDVIERHGSPEDIAQHWRTRLEPDVLASSLADEVELIRSTA